MKLKTTVKQTALLFFMSGAACATASAAVHGVCNEPDSVYMFSYSNADGAGGLKLAWSSDGSRWVSIAGGMSFVNSDFGPWGSGKRMIRPHLVQTRGDGRWHCVWEVSKTGKTCAYVDSPNLMDWRSQKYFEKQDLEKYQPKDVYDTWQKTASVGGAEYTGWVQRVAYSTVESLLRFADHRALRFAQNSERTEQDATRFAGLKTVGAKIVANAADRKAISTDFIGIFFEDINYAADGGLYAELVQNRDFEYSAADMARGGGWDHDYAWSIVTGGKQQKMEFGTDNPIHANNKYYAVVNADGTTTVMKNTGYDGIALRKGEKYDFSMFARVAGGKGGKVAVSLLDAKGNEVAAATVSVTAKDWKKLSAVLTAKADVEAGALQLRPLTPCTLNLDMISLFPENTFRGHKNGLRADLAQTLADLKPRFVRFPGGCVAHGNGIDNMYDWKGSIGPLESRKPLRNIWGYHQTRGLGYYEYFQFCEDMGAEPVPVLAAGVPCQNSGIANHNSTCELDTYGQQGGIPMKDMPQYIQDVLDLIEYANGDAKKTAWGRKRAEAGHPKPFNLKYIGIGNEDMITEVFEERFAMIYKAVRERHPEITVIGTVGPFYEGTDYKEGWRVATELKVPMVDEHYYVDPGWMIHNQNYYDNYDRSKSKVYLGEYAAHLPGRPNNIETAIAEALYLTAVERNADVVAMTSYAPLLVKENHTQWRPDLIYFNNNEVKPTVDYYTQQMYGQNAGTHYVNSTVTLDTDRDDVRKRVGVSVVRDERSGDYIVRLVNMLPVEVSADVRLDGMEIQNPTAVKTVLTGDPKDKNARPVTSDFELGGTKFNYAMPKYSFTVIRIKGENKTKK